MKRTILKIEHEEGFPLEIEVNGKRLSRTVERAGFFAAVTLAAVGVLLLIVYVILPLLGIALGLIFAIFGVGLLIVGVIVSIVIIGGLAGGLLKEGSRESRRNDEWDC